MAFCVCRHGGAAHRERIRRRRDRSPLCVTGCEEDIMNVFLAGGSGAIGVPLVRALVAAGHQVTALTRFAANEPKLRALGATPAVADALDAEALRRVVAARPSHVKRARSRADQPSAHGRDQESDRRRRGRGRRTPRRRIVCALGSRVDDADSSRRAGGGRRRALPGVTDSRRERARADRRASCSGTACSTDQRMGRRIS